MLFLMPRMPWISYQLLHKKLPRFMDESNTDLSAVFLLISLELAHVAAVGWQLDWR